MNTLIDTRELSHDQVVTLRDAGFKVRFVYHLELNRDVYEISTAVRLGGFYEA